MLGLANACTVVTECSMSQSCIDLVFPPCFLDYGSRARCICGEHHHHGWGGLPAVAGWLHRYQPRAWCIPPTPCRTIVAVVATTDLIRYSGPSTVNDAVKVRMGSEGMEECEASADVLMSDTMDQYRTFQMCERLLHNPTKLANQLLFQIPPHRQAMLIERCDLVLHRPVLWPYQWVDILT